MGDLDDKALITKHSGLHDIIIHTATADHLPSVEAVLEGVKMRALKGQMTIFIHTSGTSVMDDKSDGQFKGERAYSDESRHDIDSVPDDAPHREIDLAIVKAQVELGEKAKLAIMIPPLIYGCRLSPTQTSYAQRKTNLYYSRDTRQRNNSNTNTYSFRSKAWLCALYRERPRRRIKHSRVGSRSCVHRITSPSRIVISGCNARESVFLLRMYRLQ